MNNKQFPGPDNIQPRILKEFKGETVEVLTVP